MVASEVQADLRQPRPRFQLTDTFRWVALERLVRAHERFLSHVLSTRSVANDPQGYSEHQILMPPDEVTKTAVEVVGQASGQVIHAHTEITQPVCGWLRLAEEEALAERVARVHDEGGEARHVGGAGDAGADGRVGAECGLCLDAA